MDSESPSRKTRDLKVTEESFTDTLISCGMKESLERSREFMGLG